MTYYWPCSSLKRVFSSFSISFRSKILICLLCPILASRGFEIFQKNEKNSEIEWGTPTKQKRNQDKENNCTLDSLRLTATLTCSKCVLTLAEQRERMNLIHKIRKSKLIVVSSLRAQDRSKNYSLKKWSIFT